MAVNPAKQIKSDYHPVIGITMGDPAGIGPEILTKIWTNEKQRKILPTLVYIGAVEALKVYAPSLDVTCIDNPSDIPNLPSDTLPCIDLALGQAVKPGMINSGNAATVIQSIDKAVSLARTGQIAGLVTAPINKAGLYEAGFDAPGHTEYLARLCDMPDHTAVMMLACETLKVIPVTTHIPLADVVKTLQADHIIHSGVIAAHDLCHRFGIAYPRLAIAGMNPHAGEGGAIGIEEATHIQPAIWALQDMGIDVSGPYSADSLFHAEARENYDVAVCMYHDQALIPIKTLDFWSGVNVTLGLPIIRTSPDHGTAFDIAGTGKANIQSTLAAIKMAADMAFRQNHNQTYHNQGYNPLGIQ